MNRFHLFHPRFLIGAIILIVVISCSEAPFEPGDGSPTGYKVYFHDANDNPKWYVYYPESDYLDSVILPLQGAVKGAISPDGNTMYLLRNLGCGLVTIDLETGEKLGELTQYCGGYLVLSPDGQWLVLGQSDIDIYRTEDMTLVHRDTTIPFQNPFFAPGGDSLYGSYRSDDVIDHYVSAPMFSLGDTALDTLPFDENRVVNTYMVATPENDKWYLRGWRPHGMVVYIVALEWDRTNDRTVMIDSIPRSFPAPMSRLSADGKYVISTRPGFSWDPDEERPNQFHVYDTELKQTVEVVDTRIVTAEGDTIYLNVEEIVFTPDSKYMVGLARDGYNWLAVYNLTERRLERFVEIPGNHELSRLLCQTGL